MTFKTKFQPKDFTLLVVDDEAILREMIASEFKRKGFKVLSAENGTKGYEIVQTKKIDLILSDIRMPGGDGIRLLEQAKKHDPELQMILITGFADVTEKICIEKGARQLILKPFDRVFLMNSVFEALGISKEEEK